MFTTRILRPLRAQGFILISALLLIVIIALMSITMMRSYGLLEKNSGTALEKQRAFQAAQTALAFGEWWLTQSSNGGKLAVQCNALVVASNTASSPGQICSNALPAPLTLPLTAGMAYTPSKLSVNANGGIDLNGNANYKASPQLYIVAKGYTADGRTLFEVTGVGYGGAAQTVAITQSTFALTSGIKNPGGL